MAATGSPSGLVQDGDAFRRLNLVTSIRRRSGQFDVVLCRSVLLYLAADRRAAGVRDDRAGVASEAGCSSLGAGRDGDRPNIGVRAEQALSRQVLRRRLRVDRRLPVAPPPDRTSASVTARIRWWRLDFSLLRHGDRLTLLPTQKRAARPAAMAGGKLA